MSATTKKETPRLEKLYKEQVVEALMKSQGYKNVNQVPCIEKIVINSGLGDAKDNAKSFDLAVANLGLITGQKPLVTLSKKAVANFKLREHQRIGAKVT